jgi:hypothetical protein
MKQAQIKRRKLEQMQKEKTEGFFMPTINKKSQILTKSRSKRSYMAPVTNRREPSQPRCRTPTKTRKRIDTHFKVTPVRRRIGADQLMENFKNTHVSNTKSILKSKSTQKKHTIGRYGDQNSTSRKITFQEQEDYPHEVQVMTKSSQKRISKPRFSSKRLESAEYEIEEMESSDSSSSEVVEIPVSYQSEKPAALKERSQNYSLKSKKSKTKQQRKYMVEFEQLEE